MADESQSLQSAVKANLSAAAAVLLFLYVIIGVLKQSDSELILPSSTFDLGGILENVKEGIPGGSFITPILQLKIPLTLFYTLGPIGLLIVHSALALDRRALADAAGALRFLAIWTAPLALALMRWRFAPYVAARPDLSPIGLAIAKLQTLALACDSVVVVIALLRRPLDSGGAKDRGARLCAVLARGCRHGATVWLIILLSADAVDLLAGHTAIGYVTIAKLALAFALLLAWIAGGGQFRRTEAGLGGHRFRSMEDLNMMGRAVLLVTFVGFAVLPNFARALDLSGESLVAKAPRDALIDTLLSDENASPGWLPNKREDWRNETAFRIADAQLVAWQADGRGIDLSRWNFPGGRFDRATMALIRMTRAQLPRASLDSANLVLADLTGANLKAASLRSASLDGSRMTGAVAQRANFSGASLIGLKAGVLPVSDTKYVAANDETAKDAATQEQAAKDPATLNEKCKKAKGPPDLRTDFSGANMTGAHLERADLSCANLAGSTMDGDTLLDSTVLIGADFSGAHLQGARFQSADLEFVTMSRETELDKTILTSAKFGHAILRGTDFTTAVGVDTADFDGADVTCAIFPATFDKSRLTNAIVTGARLSQPTDKRSLKVAQLADAKEKWPDTDAEWAQLGFECAPHPPHTGPSTGGSPNPQVPQ